MKNEWSPDDDKADLVISQPPTSPSRSPVHSVRSTRVSEEISVEEVKSFPQTIKRTLKPNAYVIIIVPFYAFFEWYSSFYEAGYEIMPHPYFWLIIQTVFR